jgi:branched-chain amino acid transport system substrate-binding protein
VDRFEPGTTDPHPRAFVEGYRAAYGEVPEFYAANYYEHVRFVLSTLVERVSRRGGDPTRPGELLAEMERAVGEGVRFPSVYGGEMQLATNGTVVKPVGVYQVKAGELTLVGRIVGGRIQS